MQSITFNINELTLEEIQPKQVSDHQPNNVGRKCLKCSHVRLAAENNVPDYECPKCGAIYDKVENVLRGN